MGLSATDVMPTSKVINRLIFMSSRSIALCLAAIARPQDFAVLLKSRCGLPLSKWRILVLRDTSSYTAIAASSDAANRSAAREDKQGLFLFDGYFGRLNYREDGIALFEIHSLH